MYPHVKMSNNIKCLLNNGHLTERAIITKIFLSDKVNKEFLIIKIDMECADILKKLKSLGNSKSKEAIAKYGTTPKEAFCVSLPNLRMMAKEIGKNHELALELWKYNIRETRILASMVDEKL